VNAKAAVSQILFQDMDCFNISSLIVSIYKIIVIKRDQTVIDLSGMAGAQSQPKMVKVGKVF